MSAGPQTVEKKKKQINDPAAEAPCVTPQDLYTAHAREKIGRLLDDWLRRRKATAFELLHRPDLAESLEASDVELQHAIQKVAIPESQATGAPVHELIRTYQKLVEGALERLITAGRKRQFPDVTPETLGAVARALSDHAERQLLFGGALARRLADAKDWPAKVDRLLELAEVLPEDPQARALCKWGIEQLLAEILASRTGLSDLLGPELDSGASLLALTRLVAPAETDAVSAADRAVAALVPSLSGPAARLARLMAADAFGAVRVVLARKVVAELNSAKRLKPNDPDGEIAVLRALAMLLTASAGRVLALDEVQAAFLERSKTLTAPDFVTALTQGRPTALAEAQALVRLAENVTGQVNRTRAAEWLSTCVDSLKFEKEFRAGGADTALHRLAALGALDRSVRRTGFAEGDQRKICARLSELSGLVETDAKLCALLARSPAAAVQKASVLLRLALGETAPVNSPVADRAKGELLKLLQAPQARAELAADADMAARLRELMVA